MKVLIACEYTGAVRDAFRARGHDAWSCDIVDGVGDYHIKDDALAVMHDDWDLMIAHPPCTHLAVSGARWFKGKAEQQAEALRFVQSLMDAPIGRICIENPVSVISSKIRPPDQIIHPYHFGDPHSKSTCLWLKGLEPLVHTNVVEPEWHYFKSGKRWPKWYYETGNLKGEERRRARDKTFPGIAKAMAEQWG